MCKSDFRSYLYELVQRIYIFIYEKFFFIYFFRRVLERCVTNPRNVYLWANGHHPSFSHGSLLLSSPLLEPEELGCFIQPSQLVVTPSTD